MESRVGIVVVDPVEEIFSNKLTTLVGRQEKRDVIDVMTLEARKGLRVEDHLAEAHMKDGGCTPATLAWLLVPWADQIDDDESLPAGLSGRELKAYMRSLAERMLIASFPPSSRT